MFVTWPATKRCRCPSAPKPKPTSPGVPTIRSRRWTGCCSRSSAVSAASGSPMSAPEPASSPAPWSGARRRGRRGRPRPEDARDAARERARRADVRRVGRAPAAARCERGRGACSGRRGTGSIRSRHPPRSRRVLRSGGVLGLVWNIRDDERAVGRAAHRDHARQPRRGDARRGRPGARRAVRRRSRAPSGGGRAR